MVSYQLAPPTLLRPAAQGALRTRRLEDTPVLQCYQRADEDRLRKAIEGRRRA